VLGYPALKRWAKLGRPYGTRRGARKRLRQTTKPNIKTEHQNRTSKPKHQNQNTKTKTSKPNIKTKHMTKPSKPKKREAEAYSQS